MVHEMNGAQERGLHRALKMSDRDLHWICGALAAAAGHQPGNHGEPAGGTVR
jgi:hypothetical protein